MLIDWTHWLSSIRIDELALVLAPLLLLDIPRYALGPLAMCLVDFFGQLMRMARGQTEEQTYEHCPSVCVILAGLNEADTIGHTLASVWSSYPRLEIVVVDDGSNDGMTTVARDFARDHAGVLVLRKPQRGGKSSALNFALPFTRAEVLICVDTDSHLGPHAIWEIVQPFADERVGAVSGTVLARNPFFSVLTCLQAWEYLRVIFIGRMLAAKLDTLGIVSGAFGAFRRVAVQHNMGWDVGPGEDGDLVLRLRKARWRIVAQPYATCFTNLPTSWWRLVKQRRRWDWSAVTFECRKHVDLANILAPGFRWSNLAMVMERWLYNVILPYVTWGYLIWLALHWNRDTMFLLLLCYGVFVGFELLQLGLVAYYSTDWRRDLSVAVVIPLMPLYYLYLRAVSVVAVTEELLTRRSFRDSFVPERVRQATWHW